MNSEGRETAGTKLPGRAVSRRGGRADGGVAAPRRRGCRATVRQEAREGGDRGDPLGLERGVTALGADQAQAAREPGGGVR